MIKFQSPLLKGTLISRYKRFFADVKLENGEVVTAHCPNTGSMKTCRDEGATVYLLHNPSPTRKLDYTWELTETAGGFILINTHRPNKIVEDAILNNEIAELNGYANLRREVKYGEKSRIDLLLENHSSLSDCYVEIKNVTLKDGDTAIFPDSVTERGTKHLLELEKMADEGFRAVIFYLVNRPDVSSFDVAREIDPKYCEAFDKAIKNGVEVLIYQTGITTSHIAIKKQLMLFDN